MHGRTGGGERGARPASLPIHPASVHAFPSMAATREAFDRAGDPHLYARFAHPTGSAVENRLAALDGAEASLLFSSGMAALSAVVFTWCRPGDRLVAGEELYGGTLELLHHAATNQGIQVDLVPPASTEAWTRSMNPVPRMILVESPTNPMLRLVDFDHLTGSVAGLPPAQRPILVLDGTFATPLGQRGLARGFDLVVHSATKYLGGHDDLTAGVVSGNAGRLRDLGDHRRRTGAICDPQTAWLLDRGLKTLALRFERQCANALDLARRLEDHPGVERVLHPGLDSHPQHDLGIRQMDAFGAIVTFDTAGDAVAVYDRFTLIARAPSLGGVESAVLHPATASHRRLTPAQRARLGITDRTLRLSLGIEDVEDLWRDLDSSLRG